MEKFNKIVTGWSGNEMPDVVLACIDSWVKLGYEVQIYSEFPIQIPGVTVFNMESIDYDRNLVAEIKTKTTRISAIWNYLRLVLLRDNPGFTWVDTDVYLFKYPFPKAKNLLVTEDIKGSCGEISANNNFLKLDYNNACDAIYELRTCVSQNTKIPLGTTGPRLLDKMWKSGQLDADVVMSPKFVNSVPWWDFYKFYSETEIEKNENTFGLHLWLNMKTFKEIEIGEGCFIDNIVKKYKESEPEAEIK